ncbi:galactonate dehydratase [Amycolatopsis mediterranei S699]|uniref:Galactonate dehydratase n=2 Tax=Amycolatopsis mediterranei TaxID=33910 RepID=A0A0H3DDF0_AMYMU|nr:mandelate racemase/muconate lactonizing enzyme family protein [Amycolatopsis mediterranei]ADJ48955.1 galactonate dehydratase [Amycolatopsis mediterranei U32]AEK45903.1 galactonate dehydratase [Amycolatopsis mediterranei S699]AFO80663.1 galactonate dehydratase [Amycolatopsis mediterranei S699]AGT87791.1 galactonate dehydratase [Amycolatopsis mediterranei RB]KDU93927.1 galactokinase [Amycolatopsis mediterranei]
MRITDLQTHHVGRYLFVSVYTDVGITGLGEVGAWAYLDAVEAILDKWRRYLVGQDPARIEHHWQYLYQSTFFRGAIVLSALAAVDIALWDIKGKRLGVPVHELFGGPTRDRVRSYAPVFGSTAEEMAAGCVELRDQGFTAARLVLPSFAEQRWERGAESYAGRVDDAVRKVLACREAVGPGFDLCVEAHRSLSVPEAIAVGRGIEQARPLFFEDPIAPESPDAMAEVARAVPVPIATGERAISVQEIQALLTRGATRYVRPDVCAVGGLTPARKIAALAEAHYVAIVPHNPLGPVSTAACLHLDASVPNFLIQEHPSFNTDGGEDVMIKDPLQFEAGYLAVPGAPGIGIELAPDAETLFPPAPRDLTPALAFDGSVQAR